MYASMASHWPEPERVVAERSPSPAPHDRRSMDQTAGLRDQAMYLDTITYLPNDILVKLDARHGFRPGGTNPLPGSAGGGIRLAVPLG